MPTEKRTCPCKRLPMCLSSFTAAEYGDIHSLEASMKRQSHHSLDRVDAGGYTPLHLAAQHGHVAATSFLLQLGAKPDSNECGATPLLRASYSGAISTMRLLLEEKWQCDLLSQDTSFGDKMTPLHKAAAGGRPLAVKLLLDTLRERRGRNDTDDDGKSMLCQGLQALDSLGRTPLEVAMELSKNQQEEQQSVRRWDAVAGDVADWNQCVELLKSAENEIRQGAEANGGETRSRLPALPKHLSGGSSCLDCDATGDGSCLTASWEAAFRSALSSSIPSSNVSTSARPIPQVIVQEANDTIKSVEESVVDKQPRDITPSGGMEGDSEQAAGRPCDSCGVPSFALYPSQSGELLCRACFKPTRKVRR